MKCGFYLLVGDGNGGGRPALRRLGRDLIVCVDTERRR